MKVRDLLEDDEWLPERRRAIGARIRDERLRQNTTQDDVWMAARITRWTYQRVEAGEERRLSTLLRIAWVLEVPLAGLVGERPAPAIPLRGGPLWDRGRRDRRRTDTGGLMGGRP